MRDQEFTAELINIPPTQLSYLTHTATAMITDLHCILFEAWTDYSKVKQRRRAERDIHVQRM